VRTLLELERDIAATEAADRDAAAHSLLALAEEALEAWVMARGEVPTTSTREGFRLLALHHQGARGIPSFNACRETCREIAYHYNLLGSTEAQVDPGSSGAPTDARMAMMRFLVRHVAFFVHGKMEVEGLGDFCCASKPLRAESGTIVEGQLRR